MQDNIILKIENISKRYRLGLVGRGTINDDLKSWWYKIRGKEDPFLTVGETNDRTTIGVSEYVWALQNINFEVKRGEVLGIIGANGAGKSTLLKILSKITSPTTGSIKSRGRIASLLEVGTGFHGELTGRENIYLNGAILGMTKAEITDKLDEIIEFSGCERYIDTPVKRYSSGMTVRLAFAVAAFLEPDILIVDEVLAVGDAEFQKKAIGKMKDISKGEGRTVLFVSHNMHAVQKLCSRGIVLENGGVVYDGRADDAIDKYISSYDEISRDEVVFNKESKLSKINSPIELIKITSKSRNPLIRGELKFDIEIEVKQIIDRYLCLTGSICLMDDTRLGSFFSESFKLFSDNKIIELTIPNHNLSVGIYYINIALSKGSLEDDNLDMIDFVYRAIAFEIFQIDNKGDYLIKWNKSWGNIYLQSKINIK